MNFTRTHYIAGVGKVQAELTIENNRIQNFRLLLDGHPVNGSEAIGHLLEGVAFDREAVSALITDPFDFLYQSPLRGRDLIRLLFGRERHLAKPEWLKIDLSSNKNSSDTGGAIHENRLHTICESGLCPNRAECWRHATATLMIGGEICTRSCKFCNTRSGRPLPSDPDEPRRVADAVRRLALRYAVITSVDRDDLPDMGAALWRDTLREVRSANKDIRIEALLPDFQGRMDLLDIALEGQPDIAGHNMETVRRLTPSVRSVARYDTSLSVLRHITESGYRAKTGIMVGLGETDEEIMETLHDIFDTGCRILTIGQYLQPTSHHLPVQRYVSPQRFTEYGQAARRMGFTHVQSGPLVRSSYRAEEALAEE
ncbi:MAG: lipoyl synthase [Prevotella sp.]